MNIAIIDNNSIHQFTLSSELRYYAKDQAYDFNIDIYSSAAGFLNNYASDKYDILFLDMDLEDMPSMMLGQKIRQFSKTVALILTSTTPPIQLSVMQLHPFDYLFYPVNSESVSHTMDDYFAYCEAFSMNGEKYIEFTIKNVTTRVFLKNLLSVSVQNRICYICVVGKEHTVYALKQSFSSFCENIINEPNFILVNRGYMINMDHITEFKDGRCYLSDGYSFPVKVREKNSIEQKWQLYKMSQ